LAGLVGYLLDGWTQRRIKAHDICPPLNTPPQLLGAHPPQSTLKHYIKNSNMRH
jgi:hypothetical protein